MNSNNNSNRNSNNNTNNSTSYITNVINQQNQSPKQKQNSVNKSVNSNSKNIIHLNSQPQQIHISQVWYKLFNKVIFLTEVMRQKWENILPTDSEVIKQEKYDQRQFIEMLKRIHDNQYNPEDLNFYKKDL